MLHYHVTDEDTPDALDKAFGDPFFYALGLRNGQVFEFTEAVLSERKGWVILKGITFHMIPHLSKHMEYSFDRGVEIRLEEIAWVADAPYGS